MDILKCVLIGLIVALAVSLACALVITWNNTGSRNLVLGTGALAGAVILFSVQLVFELTKSVVTEFISAEYTIDRKELQIRAPKYPESCLLRPGKELGAAAVLGKTNPDAYKAMPEKVTHDMVVYSVLAYLATTYPDWQQREIRYKGSLGGTITKTQRISDPKKSTVISDEELRQMLSSAGNLFAENSPSLGEGGNIYLPQNSTLEVADSSVVIRNPFCKTTFSLSPSGAISYSRPGHNGEVKLGDKSLEMPDGSSRYETRLIGIKAEIVYYGLRANNRLTPKYREWGKSMLNGMRNWFETN